MTDSSFSPHQNEPDLKRAPLLAHLLELRRRLLYVLIPFFVAFVISYYFSEHIYAFLTAPLRVAMDSAGNGIGRRMIYTGLHEAFVTYFKLSLFSALFVSIPFIINQLWKFLAPGLYQFERRSLRPFLVMTPLMFLIGAAVAYYIVFPLAWSFFLSFETLGSDSAMAMQLEARVGEYLNLVTMMIIAFGLSFELPVLLLLLARLGMVSANNLVAYRRHAIVLIFAVAAVITPPDMISQLMLGIPLVLLYELSILLIRWWGRQAEAPVAGNLET